MGPIVQNMINTEYIAMNQCWGQSGMEYFMLLKSGFGLKSEI